MKSTIFNFLIIASGLFFVITTPSLLFAQEVSVTSIANTPVLNDFILSPTRVDVSVDAGASETFIISITNRLGRVGTFSLTSEDVSGIADIEASLQPLGNDVGPFSVKDMLLAPAREVTLAHGEKASIPIVISVPESESDGGRYGAVMVSLVEEGAPGEVATGATLRSRVGTVVLATIGEGGVPVGMVNSFDTLEERRFYTNSKIPFRMVYENTGSVHVRPSGVITLRNAFGRVVSEIPVDPWYIIPGSLRSRVITYEGGLMFGPYTATLELYVSGDEVSDVRTYSVIVLPKSVLLVFVVIILLLAFLRRRKFVRTQFEKDYA